MRKWLVRLGVIGGMLGFVGAVLAQTGPLWTCSKFSVSSSSSPIAAVSPGRFSSFDIHPWSAGEGGGDVVVWPYTGAVPAAVATTSEQLISADQHWGDTSVSDYRVPPPIVGQGFAVVVPTGSATVSVTACTR